MPKLLSSSGATSACHHDGRRTCEVPGTEVGDGRLVRAGVTEDGMLEPDVVVLGTGMRRFCDLAADAGSHRPDKRDPHRPSPAHTGGRRLGGWRRCGDLPPHLVPSRLDRPSNVNDQGRIAGGNLGGSSAALPGGAAVAEVGNLEIAQSLGAVFRLW